MSWRFRRLSPLGVLAAMASCAPAPAQVEQTASSGNVAALHQQAMVVRRACFQEMRQMQLSGVARTDIERKRQECSAREAAIMRPYAEQHLVQELSIAAETLHLDAAAQAAAKAGNDEEALRLFKAIDANAPAIKAEVAQKAPPGVTVSMSASPAQNSLTMDMDALLGELAAAQRKIGQYYEYMGQYSTAASWYEKANASMHVRGGRDMAASVHLGFLYAFGRGVPRDRAKAMELFGGRSEGLFAETGATESAYAYLLDYNRLPEHVEDVTPGYIKSVETDLLANHAMNSNDIAMLAFGLLLISGGGRESAGSNAFHHGPSSSECAAIKFMGGGPLVSGGAGCAPWTW